jgi:hypothetical protein
MAMNWQLGPSEAASVATACMSVQTQMGKPVKQQHVAGVGVQLLAECGCRACVLNMCVYSTRSCAQVCMCLVHSSLIHPSLSKLQLQQLPEATASRTPGATSNPCATDCMNS